MTRQPAKGLSELVLARGIERCRRLVQEEKRRIDGEGARDGDSLRFPSRKLAAKSMRPMVDADLIEKRLSPPFRVGAGNSEHVHRSEPDVRERREVLEEKVELEDHSHLLDLSSASARV